MIPLLGIPVLNRGDLLERLITSIDEPVKKLFIINNGDDAGVQAAINKVMEGIYPFIQEWIIHVPPKNLGVAPSWNTIIKHNSKEDYWIICASDMCFLPGEAKLMADFAEQNHRDNTMIYADGYSCFCMTQKGLDVVGTFDENIFPAYLEDSDHFYRLKLSGATACGFPGVKMIHGEAPNWGSSTINSNKKYSDANGITHGRNFEYYRKKWGGGGGEEIFLTPFNKPEYSIKFWELDLERRKLQEQAWS